MKINKSFSSEPRTYSENVKINLSIDPETIPVLIPQKSLQEIQKIETPQGDIQDPKPYYVTEEIEDITKSANDVEFTKEFWESYLAVMKKRPIPGRKKGHLSPRSYGTPENDFYVIGGKLEKNKVYLKIYIPPEGFENSNKSLIRDSKVGLLNFSIVSWTEDIIERDENGIIKSIKAIRSVKGERNDRVEPGMGAMPQKVNKEKPGKEPDKKEYIMGDEIYSDVIKNLKNHIDNGKVSILQIAKDLKIKIITSEHIEALKTLKEIKEMTGENPVETIKQLKDNEQTVKQEKYDNLREKLMTEEFGTEKIEENGQKKENLKRAAAEPHVSKEIQDEKTLKEQIETAKENPVVKNMSFQYADVNSNINDFTGKTKINSDTNYRKKEHVEV